MHVPRSILALLEDNERQQQALLERVRVRSVAEEFYRQVVSPYSRALLNFEDILREFGVRQVTQLLQEPSYMNPRIVLRVETTDVGNGVLKLNGLTAEATATARWFAAGAKVPDVIKQSTEITTAFLMPFIEGFSFVERTQQPTFSERESIAVLEDVARTVAIGHKTGVAEGARPWDQILRDDLLQIEIAHRMYPDVFPVGWREWLEPVKYDIWPKVSSHGDLHPQNMRTAVETGRLGVVLDIDGSQRPALDDVARLIVDSPFAHRMHAMAVKVASAYGDVVDEDLDMFIGYEALAVAGRVLKEPGIDRQTLTQVWARLVAAGELVEHGETVRENLSADLISLGT